jgi:DnaJ-class molecular chaperone
MQHMQQFSNMGGGEGEKVGSSIYGTTCRDSETAAVWENRIFSCLTKTACYKKEVEITFENAYLGCKQNINFERFSIRQNTRCKERHYNHKYSAGNRRRRINFN